MFEAQGEWIASRLQKRNWAPRAIILGNTVTLLALKHLKNSIFLHTLHSFSFLDGRYRPLRFAVYGRMVVCYRIEHCTFIPMHKNLIHYWGRKDEVVRHLESHCHSSLPWTFWASTCTPAWGRHSLKTIKIILFPKVIFCMWLMHVQWNLDLAELKCNWIELFLVPAVRYSRCRLQLAVYQVANINLLYIFWDRNITVYYKNMVMETGAK